MTRNKPKDELPEWDDGHTVADMDVEGMPWHRAQPAPLFPRREGAEQLTDRQTRQYAFGALKAGLLVILVYCACIILFVLFCLFVWFRV